jgi:hypothetical protein
MMTEREAYALGLVNEEASEIGQMQGKWLRFGPDHARRDGLTARVGLSMECGDMLAAIDYGIAAGVLNPAIIAAQYRRKHRKLCDPNSVDDEGRRLAPEVGASDDREPVFTVDIFDPRERAKQ